MTKFKGNHLMCSFTGVYASQHARLSVYVPSGLSCVHPGIPIQSTSNCYVGSWEFVDVWGGGIGCPISCPAPPPFKRSVNWTSAEEEKVIAKNSDAIQDGITHDVQIYPPLHAPVTK